MIANGAGDRLRWIHTKCVLEGIDAVGVNVEARSTRILLFLSLRAVPSQIKYLLRLVRFYQCLFED